MHKVYHFKLFSLMSAKMPLVILAFVILFIGADSGISEIYRGAQEFGGLWVILILVIAAFGETFINLFGHRLEIRDDFFIFKTVFGPRWAIPISSIQRIDPAMQKQRNKGTFFTFTTDNKDYECGFEPKNYNALVTDLTMFNPKIQVQDRGSSAMLWGMPANVPLNKFFENKISPTSPLGKIVIKITSMDGVIVFAIFLVLMVLGIIGLVFFEDYINGR